MTDAVVYLVPLGAGRFELYSEPPDEHDPDHPPDGYFRRQFHRIQERWRAAVQSARGPARPSGRVARARDWIVCRAAETIAEQRTLWALRQAETAVLVFPADLPQADADAKRLAMLGHARRHHGRWVIVDTLLFAVSGIFMLVPGPNVLAYYFGLRMVGHFLSWRGAGQALDRTRWVARDEPALAELGRLAHLPRDARAPHVAAIAHALNLQRLHAFFDRAAAPAR